MKLFPILFGFYVVGFCNIAGVATSYVQSDFQLNNTVAGFLPAAVFSWFLLLSAPVARMMQRMGYKKTVYVGLGLTLLGTCLPLLAYNYPVCLLAFSLLGAGSVVLQLALNPLLSCVVTGEALSGSLTSSRMIVAVSSFCGPFLAAFAVSFWGSWHYMFLVFAVLTLVSAGWLLCTFVQQRGTGVQASTKQALGELKTPGVLFLFLAAIAVIGGDVGMNVVTPKLMMERCGQSVQDATLSSGVYFACRALGIFVSTMLLVNFAGGKYFRTHVFIVFAALLALFFVDGEYLILILVGTIGFACSSLFVVICHVSLRAYPQKINEVSVLMMMSICGGAIIPVLMGIAADCVGSQMGSLLVISLSVVYLVYCSFKVVR